LQEAPDAGVDGGDDSDSSRARAVRGEVERRKPRGERVVQVVHEPGLRAGSEYRVAEAPLHESPPERQRLTVTATALLVRDMGGRVADEDDRDQRPRQDERERSCPDDRARGYGGCQGTAC